MPAIIVFGIPKELKNTEVLKKLLLYDIPNAVVSIEELGLEVSQVSVFCPQDALAEGLGEELIAFVQMLTDKPERTKEVKDRLADAVGKVLAIFAGAHIPQCELVEVKTETICPDEGFSSILIR